ncbi:MAG: 4'-phosphopantetheinyl transferase superfamily protein [Bacteroidota bacterium]|nr:4'-phosphopantetheinyl transferase superfamily protein [Bacteroidota bacterium]
MNKIDSNLSVGVWEITETKQELEKRIDLSVEEKKQLNEIKFENKKLQWLSIRALLKEMLGRQFQIIYTKTGKPFLKNSSLKISISHTDKFAALVINRKEETGIDIEKVSNKVERIKNKFLNSSELENIGNSEYLEKLHVYWGAKESLYKVYGEKELIFKENLMIAPFEYLNSGTITGKIKKDDSHKNYLLKYEKVQGYVLVYVLEEINLQT